MNVNPQMTTSNGERIIDFHERGGSKDDVTVVIPTLNEEKAIGPVLEDLMREGYFNIVVVDGYSKDETINVAEKYGVAILSQHGRGKTGAIKTAIEHVKTPYIVVMDGDYTYDARDVDNFLLHMRKYKEIIGTRLNGRNNIPLLNRFGNWIINCTFNLFFNTHLNDVCSGMYCLDVEFAKGLKLETNGFDVEVEIAAQTASEGSITEVPINYRNRIGQKKLNPIRDGLNIFSTVWKLAKRYNPILLYSGLASLSFIPAMFILGFTLLEWLRGIWREGPFLLGVVLMLISVQCFSLGVISTQQSRIERRIVHKIIKDVYSKLKIIDADRN